MADGGGGGLPASTDGYSVFMVAEVGGGGCRLTWPQVASTVVGAKDRFACNGVLHFFRNGVEVNFSWTSEGAAT